MQSNNIGSGNNKHSKTMRLDILPGIGSSPFAVRTRGEASDLDAQPRLGSEFFRQLFLNAYDATLITDMQGEVVKGNLRAHEFLVGEGESLLGVNIVQIISGADDSLIAKLTSLLATERFARINAWCQRSDQSYFPSEIAVHRLRDGAAQYLCFFVRDITWRKETEERLQTVDTAVRTARAGILVSSLKGQVIYANQAMSGLCGRDAGTPLKGAHLENLIADAGVAQQLLETVRDGKAWHGEVQLSRPDGTKVVTECDAVGNVDTEGELAGVVLSFVDMTDRQRAEQAERDIERNRVMMESIGGVCHHLGQPATVLLNSIEMMMRLREADAQDREELLKMSLSAAESLSSTLRELNDLRCYRTEPYLSGDDPDYSRIVAL
ncbi:MAG: PAS domain S-box protein [Kiritimatiellae bacterium]|nr:PAS domain S-box protein [Kiritimatiellia bacterium]